jgi:hypothetical protein
MFTTVAEDTYMVYPYCDAGGKTVDLAIKDEKHDGACLSLCDASYCGIHFCRQSQQKETIQTKSRSSKVCFMRQHCNCKRVDTTTHTQVFWVDAKQLSHNARHQALTSLMFLTEKCSGEVKARVCTNGSTQSTHVAKEEATAPTVTLEAICIQCTIFAHKRQDVASCDIPGAFLQADNPNIVLMPLDGILAELLIKGLQNYTANI